MIYDELCSDLTRHLFDINNGDMYTDANLWQSHNQGYAENCTFNYGFVNVGSNDSLDKDWLPLKGDIIEYWHIPSENIRCVELRANDNSYGIRQRLMDYAGKSYFDNPELTKDYAEGFYLITWKDRARRGDDGATVNDAYTVRVTIGDPCENEDANDVSEELISKSISDEIVNFEWRTRTLFLRLKRADEFNSQQKNIWISFKNTHDGTFGTLITDVEVHPIVLETESYIISPQEKRAESVYNADLGYTDDRCTESIAWIQAHNTSPDYINSLLMSAETTQEKDAVFASAAPAMPYLYFGGINNNDFKIEARLVVKYERNSVIGTPDSLIETNTENIKKDTVTIPATGTKTITGTWNIFEEDKWMSEIQYGLFGGNATVFFDIYDSADNKINNDPIEYNFRIAGENPNDDICEKFIKYQAEKKGLSDMAWCIPSIAKHESFGYGGRIESYRPYVWVQDHNVIYNQFRAGGGHHNRYNGREGIPLWTRSESAGAGGFGMFQVTGDIDHDIYYAVPRKVIWNWQENVIAGLEIFEAKYDEALGNLNKQKQQQQAVPNTQNLPAYRVKHDSPSPGASYDFTFEEGGDKKMVHLCALKQYNGATSDAYLTKTEAEAEDRSNGVERIGDFVLCPAGAGYYCAWISSYSKNGYNITNKWAIGPYVGFKDKNNIEHHVDYVDKVLSMVNYSNNEN